MDNNDDGCLAFKEAEVEDKNRNIITEWVDWWTGQDKVEVADSLWAQSVGRLVDMWWMDEMCHSLLAWKLE